MSEKADRIEREWQAYRGQTFTYRGLTYAVGLPEPVRVVANPTDHDALIQAEMNKLTDLGSTLLQRNAALVALCEEVIADLSQTEDEWRPEMQQAVVEYRERLARLKGQA